MTKRDSFKMRPLLPAGSYRTFGVQNCSISKNWLVMSLVVSIWSPSCIQLVVLVNFIWSLLDQMSLLLGACHCVVVVCCLGWVHVSRSLGCCGGSDVGGGFCMGFNIVSGGKWERGIENEAQLLSNWFLWCTCWASHFMGPLFSTSLPDSSIQWEGATHPSGKRRVGCCLHPCFWGSSHVGSQAHIPQGRGGASGQVDRQGQRWRGREPRCWWRGGGGQRNSVRFNRDVVDVRLKLCSPHR